MRVCPNCGSAMVRWGHGRMERWRCPPCSQKRRKRRHKSIEGEFGAPRQDTPEPRVVIEDSDMVLYHGDCLDVLSALPDQSVHMVATSPPFYGLRDYGIEGQIGLEETPEEWVERLVEVFRECRRVLRDDGILWVEIGDSYAGGGGGNYGESKSTLTHQQHLTNVRNRPAWLTNARLKVKDLLGQPWMLAFALRNDGWYLRSEIIWSRPNPMPESVTDRPTKSHSTVFLLAKGQWKSRVVALSDLHGEFVHVGNHVGSKNPNMWAHEFGVRLATAILDSAQREDQFSLPPLDSEIWEKAPDDIDGFRVAGLPIEHRAAVYAARLLSTHGTAKEFLCEIDRLGVTLAERDKFLVLGGESLVPLPPGVDRYGETAIAIHDSGEIGEIDFTAHTVKCSWPSGCSYFYDADAIREAFSDKHSPGENRGAGQGFRWNSPHYTEQDGPLNNTLGGLPPEAPRGPDGRRVTAVQGKENSEQHRDGERWPNPEGANARSVWMIATEPTPFAHFATWPTKLVAKMILAGCPERGTVLDPFAGSGTTLMVARSLSRQSIGIELNEDYCKLAAERTQQLSLLT